MIERFDKEWVRTEYRINKKGAECYRTDDKAEAYTRLSQLQAKRPGVYTMQTRKRRENRYGQPITPGCKDGWGLWA